MKDGLPNGKGIAYDINNVIYTFEGTFVNGVPKGKGVACLQDGFVAHNVELKCWNLHGHVTVVDDDNELIFDGQYNNGVRVFGTEYYEGNETYVGQFNAKEDRHGTGVMYKGNFVVYKGGWENNEYENMGNLYDSGKLVYSGLFKQGLYMGLGKLYNPDGTVRYSGFFHEGTPFEGTMYKYSDVIEEILVESNMEEPDDDELVYELRRADDDSLVYKGSMDENLLYSGVGESYHRNGYIHYKGVFVKNQFSSGLEYNNSGSMIYRGEFKNGLRSGNGTEYCVLSKDAMYSGMYRNGVPDGLGKCFWASGYSMNGTFRNGKADGLFFVFDPEGEIVLHMIIKGDRVVRAIYGTESGKTIAREMDNIPVDYEYFDGDCSFFENLGVPIDYPIIDLGLLLSNG